MENDDTYKKNHPIVTLTLKLYNSGRRSTRLVNSRYFKRVQKNRLVNSRYFKRAKKKPAHGNLNEKLFNNL